MRERYRMATMIKSFYRILLVFGLLQGALAQIANNPTNNNPPANTQVTKDEWLPMRFEYYYSGNGYASLSEDDKADLADLVTSVMETFEKMLLVRRTENTTIQFETECIDGSAPPCKQGCKHEVMNCGGASLPPNENVFKRCDCGSKNSGPFCNQGEGQIWADMVVFIEVENKDSCVGTTSSTLAFARHCRKSKYKRPDQAYVNICPDKFKNRAPQDKGMWQSTIEHEFTHALVFSSDLFPLFVDKDGKSRNVQQETDKTTGYNYVPGVTAIITHDWATATGVKKRPLLMMVTERVKKFVQDYFDCPTLEGAELELQGGTGTAFTHWEKRIYDYETMSGVTTTFGFYSGLTRALLEDSGWYKISSKYNETKQMDFGYKKGCAFVMSSCLDYIQKNAKNPFPYCTSDSYSCSRDRTTKMSCTVAKFDPNQFKKNADWEFYQYDNGGNIFRSEANTPGQILAGSHEHSDYCPVYMKYHTKSNPDDKSDTSQVQSVCTDSRNTPTGNRALEVFSETARCYDIEKLEFKENSGRYSTYSTKTGCYETRCINKTLQVKPKESPFYTCHGPETVVFIDKAIPDRNGKTSFSIKCPKCEDICGKANCDTPKPDYPREVGDKKKNVSVGQSAPIFLLIATVTAVKLMMNPRI